MTRLSRLSVHASRFTTNYASLVSYKEAKKNAKRVVWVQKQIASQTKFADVDLKGPEIHRMAKQMR